MERRPRYRPLVTFALVFLCVGVAGLLLDDLSDPSSRLGIPMGFVYGVLVVGSLGLLGVAAYVRAQRRQAR